MWDLEATKMVRTLTGHRSNCTAVEFLPFGEFFASGSMDTKLKIWDIRKKGCIHAYKGHTRGISTIRFSPDGHWVVSGGYDNVVKVWDLTAGQLMHDFKFHEGHIRSIDFHPLEFLLATGSADRTIKFWDLETFELIGSARPEATGIRSITFHPDGRTLFCGLDDSLKVYSWEPVLCHDAVDMGWSTLGDLCIHDGKLLGCSSYRNSVGVWVADVSLIEPYGDSSVPDKNSLSEEKYDLQESPLDKVRGHRRSTSNLQCMSPDYETKEIKNIYVDSDESINCSKPMNSVKIVNGVAIRHGWTRSLVQRFEGRELFSDEVQTPDLAPHKIPKAAKKSPMLNSHLQSPDMGLTGANDGGDVTEGLMQDHDVFLSTLNSRLTKLQVVRHFWDKMTRRVL